MILTIDLNQFQVVMLVLIMRFLVIEGDLVKLGILVNSEPVDALAMIIHKDFAQKLGRQVCEKLKDLIRDTTL